MSSMVGSLRGSVLEAVARRYDSRYGPVRKGARERTYDGRRWRSYTSFDWLRNDGTKVEAKSARLSYECRSRVWKFVFSHVKVDAFDLCYLVCYTPWGIYLGEWDGSKLRSSGQARNWMIGGDIVVLGIHGHDWESSLHKILRDKFPGNVHAYMPWHV